MRSLRKTLVVGLVRARVLDELGAGIHKRYSLSLRNPCELRPIRGCYTPCGRRAGATVTERGCQSIGFTTTGAGGKWRGSVIFLWLVKKGGL